MENPGNEIEATALTAVRVVTPREDDVPPDAQPSLSMADIVAPTPWLLGTREEFLLKLPALPLESESTGMWTWWIGPDLEIAAVRMSVGEDVPLEEQVAGVYRELLRNLRGRWLYRIWNYVPAINEWVEGQENYRRFNQGRALAFQAYAGEPTGGALPAASAVGAIGSDLVIYALCGRQQPEFHENPEQVPAYQYPEQYGPIPPSFARGGVVELAGHRLGYISGTAAIKGHASQCAGDLAGQIRVTIDNLRLMGDTLGFPGAFQGAGSAGLTRFLRIYLRHPAQAEEAHRLLAEAGLPLADGEFTIVQADVCRADLDIEIEARLQLPSASGEVQNRKI